MDRSRNFEEGEGSNARRRSRRVSRRNAPLRDVNQDLNEEERYFFRNRLAQERYNSQIRSKKIVPTKRFVGVHRNIVELFDGRNWLFLIQNNWSTNNNLVREFYANLEIVDYQTLSSYLRGVHFNFTPDLIAQILRVTREPEWIHPFCADLASNFTNIASILCDRYTFWDGSSVMLSQGKLSILARLLHFFVGVFLLPVFHTGNVTIERAIAILTIMQSEPIDLAGVIFENMRSFCIHPSKSFGYGFLITALADLFGVARNDTDIVVAPLVIDGNTIAKSQGQRANARNVVSDSENEEDEEEEENGNEEMDVSPPHHHAPQYGEYSPYPPCPEELPQYFHNTYDIMALRGSEMQKGMYEMQKGVYEIQQEQILSRQSQITLIESLTRIEEQMRNLTHGRRSHFEENQGGNANVEENTEILGGDDQSGGNQGGENLEGGDTEEIESEDEH